MAMTIGVSVDLELTDINKPRNIQPAWRQLEIEFSGGAGAQWIYFSKSWFPWAC
jgi:hypothetical protein